MVWSIHTGLQHFFLTNSTCEAHNKKEISLDLAYYTDKIAKTCMFNYRNLNITSHRKATSHIEYRSVQLIGKSAYHTESSESIMDILLTLKVSSLLHIW